jgi:hypothetical protein
MQTAEENETPDGSCGSAATSQMRLDFLNRFALVLSRPTVLAFRSIQGVGARIVAIASRFVTVRQDKPGRIRKESSVLKFRKAARG